MARRSVGGISVGGQVQKTTPARLIGYLALYGRAYSMAPTVVGIGEKDGGE